MTEAESASAAPFAFAADEVVIVVAMASHPNPEPLSRSGAEHHDGSHGVQREKEEEVAPDVLSHLEGRTIVGMPVKSLAQRLSQAEAQGRPPGIAEGSLAPKIAEGVN